jgi:hypothetical protein
VPTRSRRSWPALAPCYVKAERNLPRSAEVKLPRWRARRSAGLKDGRLRSWVDDRVAAVAAVA